MLIEEIVKRLGLAQQQAKVSSTVSMAALDTAQARMFQNHDGAIIRLGSDNQFPGFRGSDNFYW